jgi:hypothetical protein
MHQMSKWMFHNNIMQKYDRNFMAICGIYNGFAHLKEQLIYIYSPTDHPNEFLKLHSQLSSPTFPCSVKKNHSSSRTFFPIWTFSSNLQMEFFPTSIRAVHHFHLHFLLFEKISLSPPFVFGGCGVGECSFTDYEGAPRNG